MRKTLIAGAMIFASVLTAMGGSPTEHGKSAMSVFKPQSHQSLSVTRQSNKTFCVDRTSDVMKKHLEKQGVMTTQSFNGFSNVESRVTPAQAPLKADEQTYALTVNLKYDREEMTSIINALAVSNTDDRMYFDDRIYFERLPNELVFMVPEGNYDVVMMMDTNDGDFVVLEASEIEVSEDTLTSLDVADATVEIKWNALLPDGTVPQAPYIILDPVTGEDIGTEPANMLARMSFLDIENQKNGTGGSIMFKPTTLIIGDTQTEVDLGNIRIMPGLDYKFYYTSIAIGYDGEYIIPLMAGSDENVTVTNDVSHYKTIKPEFAASRYKPEPLIYEDEDGNLITEEFNPNRINYLQVASVKNGIVDGFSASGLRGPDKELNNSIYICQDPAMADKFMVLPIPMRVEDWEWEYPVVTLPIETGQEASIALGKNNLYDFNAYNMLPDDSKLYVNAFTNPWLSFDISTPHVWNYGCPTMVFSSEVSPWGNVYGFSYIGRLGERRKLDKIYTEGLVSVDGEAPSDEVLEGLQWGELPDQGKIELEFTDTNVIIGELTGKNVTSIGFDMSREDWCPPTLQLVRFVDTDGGFTDSYADGKDGVIEFYGGDFTTHYNLENYNCWMTEEPANDVKVEYAPYDSDSFLPLEVENVAERDFMPGFGTYYRGSLAQVDRKSENGWFDVRITLTDNYGNYQQQTLSPAFRIESSVGIEKVTYPEVGVAVTEGMITVCGCENPVIELYSTEGLLLKRVASSNVSTLEMQHGVYLLKISDGEKQIVRKVRL